MTKIQNKQNGHQTADKSPACLVFGLSNLDIVWNLDIGIWDFRSMMVVLNCFDLAGLSSTLTYLWFFPRTTPSFFHRQYLPLGERSSRKPPQ
jgi:hypothetical protein